jgi:hypothetical protein
VTFARASTDDLDASVLFSALVDLRVIQR